MKRVMRITPAEKNDLLTSIKVIGIGGGGGNALNHMIEEGIKGVEFIAVNTDAQDLEKNLSDMKLQIGEKVTGGRGTGGNPQKGKEAAKESEEVIYEKLKNSDMVFLTAGLGGGTGTGASPIIAEAVRRDDILVVGVVTLPFKFEGKTKMIKALEGVKALKEHVNSLIIIPNEKIKELGNGQIAFGEAFKQADALLLNAVRGIAEIITSTGFINVDFEDVKTIMGMGGYAIMGIGESEGEDRVADAIKHAIENPLIERKNISGAKGILLNFTCGHDTTIDEISKGVEYLTSKGHEDAEIIFGLIPKDNFEGRLKVTVIATGFPGEENENKQEETASKSQEGALLKENSTGIKRDDSSSDIVNWTNTPSDFDKPTFIRNN